MPDFVVLHTNDLHGKLSDHGAEVISREKSGCLECLLLDSGDAISSGNIYYRPGGEPMLTRLSDLGYDAMAMGNREFHFLERGLKSKVRLARFPILCANLHSANSDAGISVKRSIQFERGGIRIAIFGLTVPMITRGMLASRFSPYCFEDPLAAAAELVSELRAQADYVIALTHIGLEKDRELAASVPGIDLIVGGHTHAVLDEPIWVGDTAVVQAGWWGHYLGKVEITLPATHGKRADVRGHLIDLRLGE
ncbi:MAG TPA: metallophosphatase [Armatimonadota bacterium]|jgi:2',3'-cyclic-nucleotide 2'-phosphodiesterase (5'-nucleotidase family)